MNQSITPIQLIDTKGERVAGKMHQATLGGSRQRTVQRLRERTPIP